MKALSGHGAPDLIIADIHMPEIDGWSFCRLPRMDEYLEFNEVPVLMISATFITDEIRRIGLENGASDHPAVPFSAAELIEKVSGLIAGKPVQASFGILIVERNDEHRNSLERAFTERGFHVRTVKNLRCDEFTDKNAPSVVVYNRGPAAGLENIISSWNHHQRTPQQRLQVRVSRWTEGGYHDLAA